MLLKLLPPSACGGLRTGESVCARGLRLSSLTLSLTGRRLRPPVHCRLEDCLQQVLTPTQEALVAVRACSLKQVIRSVKIARNPGRPLTQDLGCCHLQMRIMWSDQYTWIFCQLDLLQISPLQHQLYVCAVCLIQHIDACCLSPASRQLIHPDVSSLMLLSQEGPVTFQNIQSSLPTLSPLILVGPADFSVLRMQ